MRHDTTKRRILAIVALLASLMALDGGTVLAAPGGCDATVTAPGSINAAIIANPGGTVCLDDSGGAFNEAVVIGSGIMLKAAPGDSPIIDGSGLGALVDLITISAGVSGVTIRGLEITDYGERGVFGAGTIASPLSDITLLNLFVHDGEGLGVHHHAIDIRNASDVGIKRVKVVVGPSTIFGEAIRLQSVDDVKVLRADVDSGFVGVNFACDLCDGTEPPTNGKVVNSSFDGTFIGVLIANSTDAKIVNNEIGLVTPGVLGFGFIPPRGIRVDFLPNSGTKFINNKISSYAFGILADDLSGSNIHGNTATGNSVDGIRLRGGSAGNNVTGNTATGNTVFDLSDATCPAVENKWKGNTFGTVECAAIQ